MRQIGVLVGEVGADVIDRETIGGERSRTHFDPQRGALAAGD